MNTYDSAVEAATIDLARYDIFKYKGDLDIRSLHPTRDALALHTHRAAYTSGWIWTMSISQMPL